MIEYFLIIMNRGLILVFFILIFYIGFIGFSDFSKISNNLSDFNYNLIPVIFLFVISAFMILGIRQFFLLKQIGISLSIRDNLKLYFSGLSMIISPGGAGQLIKSYYLKKKYNYEIKETLPLVFVERFLDLICITTLIIFSLLFIQNIEIIFLASIVSLLIIMIILIIKFKKLFTLVTNQLSKISFFKKFVKDSSDTYNSLNKMTSTKSLLLGYGLGMISFSFDAIAVYFIFMAFDVDLNFFKIIASIYPSILYGALSFIPGGVGVTELTALRLLTDEGISTSLSSTIILTTRFFTIWFVTVLGFAITKILLKK
ncbi:flippase-like domain-containing protein [bacterium]|jgi:glycosyltransferase 2 family protein|nr:flippase-like domain-containing protein [bacterium]